MSVIFQFLTGKEKQHIVRWHVCLMLSVGGKAELPVMVSSMGMTMQLRGV